MGCRGSVLADNSDNRTITSFKELRILAVDIERIINEIEHLEELFESCTSLTT